MRFCSLGSGSEGNALLVESTAAGRTTRVLIDCGLPLKLLNERMRGQGLEPSQIDLVVVTHEHKDHIGGVGPLGRAHEIPILATHGTLHAVSGQDLLRGCKTTAISSHQPVELGGLTVRPIPVSHDAREPIALRLDDARGLRLAVVTDLGQSSAFLEAEIQEVDGLVLEFNHDPALLDQGPYPPSLKRRVAGLQGHLSNQQAAQILASVMGRKLQRLVAAHLSKTNNSLDCLNQSLEAIDWSRSPDVVFEVAEQEAGLGWRVLHT